MVRQAEPARGSQRAAGEPPELWLIKAADRVETCPECGERIEQGEAEAWHHASTLHFHLDCAGLPGSGARRRQPPAPADPAAG